LQRARKVALRHLYVADLVIYARDIALPACVAGIGFRQSVKNNERVAVGRERANMVALCPLYVANRFIRRRQLALPIGVAGIGFR